jgi:hypothetical protein
VREYAPINNSNKAHNETEKSQEARCKSKDDIDMAESYEPRNPNTKLYLTAKKLQDWSPIITVIVSCIGLVVIGFQACIYNEQRKLMNEQRAIMDRQLDAMVKTLAETKKSADAGVKSAGAAETQANASTTQANVSEQMVKQNERVVSAAESQADASKASADTAQRGVEVAAESMRLEQRPLLVVRSVSLKEAAKPGQKLTATVTIGNAGKTPAVRSLVVMSIGFRQGQEPPSDAIIPPERPSVTVFPPGSDFPSEVTTSKALTEADFGIVTAQHYRVFVWGTVTYAGIVKGATKLYKTEFCFFNRSLTPDERFSVCPSHNTFR